MIRYVLNTLGSFRSALAVGVGLPLLMAASANAQAPNTPVQAPTEATTERVIVTGSYIPTAETESALPVTVYTAEVLQKQGANTPVEGLRQLPSFVGNALTENDSNGGDGTAQINLRGIGAQNTLTLLSGRRTFNFSDINAISIGAVSRVEVLKDGASAIYGSDAVAGVVNFVLLNGPGEKPYEGAELFALYGNTTDTDAHVRQVYLRGGVTGLDGKVQIAAAGEYYSRANLFSRDRDIAITADQRGLGGLNNNSPTYPGRVSVIGRGALTLINQGINNPTPASYRAFGGSLDPDRFNFREFTPAIPAMEKAMYYVTGRYKVFGEGLQLYGTVMYSKVKQDNGLAPSPFSIPFSSYENANLYVPNIDPATGQPFGFLAGPAIRNPATVTAFSRFSNAAQVSIIQNSPFNPFPNRQTFNQTSRTYSNPNGAVTALAYRTIQELGNRRSFFDKDFYRYVAGADGNFNIKDNGFISRFGYDTGFVYERFDEGETDSGDATRGGLYREIINGNFDPFIGENAPTRGTAPIYDVAGNVIGERPYDNTAAAQRAAYLGHSFFYERDWLADAKTNMHLFPNLWNGGLDLAVGYEHRESQTHNVADPTQFAADQLGFNAGINYKHVQEVSSVFTELGIPLVTSTMNVPFVRSLDLSIAWRYEKFEDRDSYLKTTASFNNRNPDEDFGGTPRVSLRYQPIADLTLRAGWGQSFLSPTPFSLFSPAQQNFPQVFDPLINPQTGLPFGTLQPQGGVWQGGSPLLQPEHTDAYTAGVVWTPKFFPGFTMTADWYQLFTTDLILPAADFAQLVLTLNGNSGGTQFNDPSGCNNGIAGVTRDPVTSAITCIDSLTVNAGKRFVQGIDVTAVYELPTESVGKFTFSGGWNHFFTWKAEPVAGFGFHNFLGDYSAAFPLAPGGIPFNKGFLRGEWQWRHFDFVATGNYIGDYWDDPTFLNNQVTFDPPISTDAEPQYALHRHVASYLTLDMQLSYEFVKPAAEPPPTYAKDAKDSKNVMQTEAETSSIWQRILWGTTFTVGVNNAFDRTPLTVLGAFNDNYDTSNYSIRNRYYYLSMSKKF